MTGRLTELACVVIGSAIAAANLGLSTALRRSRLLASTGVFSTSMIALCLSTMHALPAVAVPPTPGDKPDAPFLMAPTTADTLPRSAQVAMRIRTLDRLLAKTGLDVRQLVAQAKPTGELLSEGEGGPLVPALGRGSD